MHANYLLIFLNFEIGSLFEIIQKLSPAPPTCLYSPVVPLLLFEFLVTKFTTLKVVVLTLK